MEPHQQRVVDEKAELDEKLAKLNTFCTSVGSVFSKLPPAEKVRLHTQAQHMTAYSAILGERIAAFNKS